MPVEKKYFNMINMDFCFVFKTLNAFFIQYFFSVLK